MPQAAMVITRDTIFVLRQQEQQPAPQGLGHVTFERHWYQVRTETRNVRDTVYFYTCTSRHVTSDPMSRANVDSSFGPRMNFNLLRGAGRLRPRKTLP